jgi:hypothetical protein
MHFKKNRFEAYNVGLSMDTPTGHNVTGYLD